MHFGLLIIIVVLSHVMALSTNDRSLIDNIQKTINDEETKILQVAVNSIRSMLQAIVDARLLEPSKIRALQRLISRYQADFSDASETELNNLTDNFRIIIDEKNELNTDEQFVARLNQLSLGAYDEMIAKANDERKKHYRTLVGLISPKIRLLSESGQQSEYKLIEDFNTFAYSGFISRENSYDKLKETLLAYKA